MSSASTRRGGLGLGFIIFALIAGGVMLIVYKSPKPVGEIVGVRTEQTAEQNRKALHDRLDEQSNQEARLNVLAQEACAVDAERMKGKETKLEVDQINAIYNAYNELIPQGSIKDLQERQDTYCKGKHGVG